MSKSDEVYLEVKDSVGTITINRPKQLNAFTGDNLIEMERLLAVATNDPKVGVIVLTGTGERAFCVGGDVNWEKGGEDGDSPLKDEGVDMNRRIIECPKPIIARVNGYAIGGAIILLISVTSLLLRIMQFSGRTGRGSDRPRVVTWFLTRQML